VTVMFQITNQVRFSYFNRNRKYLFLGHVPFRFAQRVGVMPFLLAHTFSDINWHGKEAKKLRLYDSDLWLHR
jgi:hypothetical protein